MIVIGRMAERYHMLPHEVAARATTYDYMIQDVLHTYDEFQRRSQQGGDLNNMVSPDSLKDIMERTHGR
jgi:hypothetical protein